MAMYFLKRYFTSKKYENEVLIYVYLYKDVHGAVFCICNLKRKFSPLRFGMIYVIKFKGIARKLLDIK